jgi:hypothetical protein
MVNPNEFTSSTRKRFWLTGRRFLLRRGAPSLRFELEQPIRISRLNQSRNIPPGRMAMNKRIFGTQRFVGTVR